MLFDIENQESTLYNFTTEFPRYWLDFQRIAKNAKIAVPFYHKLVIKKILTIPTDEFYALKNDLSKDHFKTSLLPMAVRYITKDNIYVIERPPFQLEVDFRLGSAHSGNAKMPPVKIWVPWTVMIFHPNLLMNGDFNQVRLYFNSGPIDSLDQPLVPCFYPNTHSDSRICFSTSLNDFNDVLDLSQIAEGNIGYIYNYVFNNYMMGGWNSDLTQNLFENFYRLNRDQIFIDNNCPTIKLFLDPSSSPEFYKKLSSIFPKKYFARIKKYYTSKFSSRTISKEKYYFKNFGIFAAFTLEQTINFIKEMQYVLSFKSSDNIPTINNIIEKIKQSKSDYSNLNSGPGLVTKILNFSVEYDYLQYQADLFVINNTESDCYDYHQKDALLPLDVLSEINYKLIDFLNNRRQDEHIAFVYDYSSKTFDVILNYDSKEYIENIIDSTIDTATEYCRKNNLSSNDPYNLISIIQGMKEKILNYQELSRRDFLQDLPTA